MHSALQRSSRLCLRTDLIGRLQKAVEGPYLKRPSLQQADLVVLGELPEARNALGELHHVLDGVSEVNRTLLPHHLRRLCEPEGSEAVSTANTLYGTVCFI